MFIENRREREFVMRVSKVLLTCAAASMMAAPVAATAATANPAAKLSVSKSVPASVRVAAKAGKSKQDGGSEGIIVLVLAGAAVIAGVIAATSGDSSPSSP
jgi:hypothetical protein